MKTEHKKENQLESLRQIMRDGVRDGWIEDDRTSSDAHPRASHSEQTGIAPSTLVTCYKCGASATLTTLESQTSHDSTTQTLTEENNKLNNNK